MQVFAKVKFSDSSPIQDNRGTLMQCPICLFYLPRHYRDNCRTIFRQRITVSDGKPPGAGAAGGRRVTTGAAVAAWVGASGLFDEYPA